MSGPESTVLEEQIDPNYVPSQQEVDEYAKWLGMDVVEDAHLMWIAQEGLKAPLPSDWKPCKSPEGEIYYFNFNDGSTVWDHPCDEKYRSLYRAEKKKNPDPQPAPAPSRDAKPKKRPVSFRGYARAVLATMPSRAPFPPRAAMTSLEQAEVSLLSARTATLEAEVVAERRQKIAVNNGETVIDCHFADVSPALPTSKRLLKGGWSRGGGMLTV